MTSQAQIDNIKTYLEFTIDEMPKIYIVSSLPNYMSLQVFQDAINKNKTAVPVPDIDLDYPALTMKTNHFTSVNKSAYTDPVSPGTTPSNPSTVL